MFCHQTRGLISGTGGGGLVGPITGILRYSLCMLKLVAPGAAEAVMV